MPVGSCLCHGDENEFAQMHTRVRESELRGADDEIIYGDNINVNPAIDICAFRITVRLCVNGALEGLQRV